MPRIFNDDDFKQYHAAFYRTDDCEKCPVENLNIIYTQFPVDGLRVFGIHPSDLEALPNPRIYRE